MTELSYDPDKARKNELLRGLHFDVVHAFLWDTAWILEDQRHDYGERRFRAIGLIDMRLHVVVFTPREKRMNAKSSSSASNTASRPDETNPEWMAADFQHARNAADVLPEILGKEQASVLLTRGRPKSRNPKVALTIRYDAEIVESFRATGPGWQTRMNSALREWLTMRQ